MRSYACALFELRFSTDSSAKDVVIDKRLSVIYLA